MTMAFLKWLTFSLNDLPRGHYLKVMEPMCESIPHSRDCALNPCLMLVTRVSHPVVYYSASSLTSWNSAKLLRRLIHSCLDSETLSGHPIALLQEVTWRGRGEGAH